MGVVPAVGPASKRRLRSGSVVLIAGLGVVLAVGLTSVAITTHKPAAGALGGTGVPAARPVDPAPVPVVTHTVVYELTRGGALNVTYVTQNSDLAQVAQVSTPWSASVTVEVPVRSPQYYSLTAQDTGAGNLTCRIRVDGAVVSEHTVAAPH